MKYFSCCVIIFFSLSVHAQDYNAALIPDSLKENADAVKRFEEFDVTIESINKVIVKHKYAITVLNENGDGYARYSNNYSSMIDLKDITGNLYDAAGKKLKSVKKKDIADVIEADGYSLITDDRKKEHDFFYRQYPYTVEYEDEQDLTGTYFLPYWQPVEGEKMSVMQSSFSVQMPAGYKLRFKQFNYPGQNTNAQTSNTSSVAWEIKNIKAVTQEIWEPSLNEVTPSVFLAPSDFSWGGYNGNMNTWLSLGKYQDLLNAGRDDLPDNVKQDVHRLTDTAKTILEKIKILYQYLQNNTRYISIQLGIGGWQPLPAKFVAEKKYGDCKALSNYMVSLLKEAGIKANYVVVNAGKENMYDGLHEDFPAPFFDHVITCVPEQKDTIWLECTSQTNPFGYMGSFTGNRQAFLIADDGGHIVNTPTYTANDNQQIRNIQANIDADGNLTADVTTHYTGIEQDEKYEMVTTESSDKIMDELKEEFDLPTYDITNFHYDEQKNFIPSVDEKINLTAQNYAIVSGKRLFIMPDILNRISGKLTTTSPRMFDIDYPFSFRNIDTVNIEMPAGYTVEAMPRDAAMSNKFGNYEIHFKTDADKILLIRKYERTAGRFPPSDYPDLVKFYDDMYKADHGKIVFVKQDE